MTETIRIRPGVLEWREVEGEVIAVDMRSSTYLAVSHSGAKLWPALLRGADRDELVRTIVSEFAIDEATAGEDVGRFIETLSEQDLLEV